MNITLIGMPGVGKSSIGKQIAKTLKFTFFDPDKMIEETAKLPLQKIIDDQGEAAFLELENKAIMNLKGIDNCFICPGGSIVYSKQAMLFLKKNSIVVFLEQSLESLKARIPDMSERGVIGLKGQTLEDVYKQRLGLYQKYADICVKLSDELDITSNSSQIIQAILDCKKD